MMHSPTLETDRFILRPLRPEDANEHYLSWFQDPGTDNIEAKQTTRSLADLQLYVCEKIARPDVVFLGIFERGSRLHVGNVKFEPIDVQRGYAVFGILIGMADFRGKGVAGEVIGACARWLRQIGLREIVLGVSTDNPSAIRAYLKAGFQIRPTEHLPQVDGVNIMVLTL